MKRRVNWRELCNLLPLRTTATACMKHVHPIAAARGVRGTQRTSGGDVLYCWKPPLDPRRF